MLPIVVLDACVIIPMPLCDTLLRAAEAELYCPQFSQEILDEATRNLVKMGKMTEAKATRYQGYIKAAFPEAIVEVPEQLIEIMTNHPKDRHILAAAVKAKAGIIVTSNLKDFPREALELFGIEAKHPDDFLLDLCNKHTVGVLAQVIKEQAEALKKPQTNVKEVLARLSCQVPMFVGKVLCHQYGRTVAEIAGKILKQAKCVVDGALVFEGERYFLHKQNATITITDKNGRGEILSLKKGVIEGSLSFEDIEIFEKISQKLE